MLQLCYPLSPFRSAFLLITHGYLRNSRLHLFWLLLAPQHHYYWLLIVIKCYNFNTFPEINTTTNAKKPARIHSIHTHSLSLSRRVPSEPLCNQNYFVSILYAGVLGIELTVYDASVKLPLTHQFLPKNGIFDAATAAMYGVSIARERWRPMLSTKRNAKLCTTFPWKFLPKAQTNYRNV